MNDTAKADLSSNSDYERVYIGIWYSILSLVGLVLILIVLYAIIKLKHVKTPPFYMILINLCIADVLTFCLYIFYVIPCVFSQRQLYGIVNGFSVMGFIEAALFMAVISNSFLISCNRFLCICFKNLHDRIFTRVISYCLVLGTWVFAFIMTLINVLISCRTIFNEFKYTFSTFCEKIPPYLSTESFVVYVFVYGVALCYVFIILHFLKHKNEINPANHQITTNINNRQMKFFYQALCIWLSLLLDAIGKWKKQNVPLNLCNNLLFTAFRILPYISLSGFPAAVCSSILIMSPNYVTSICMLVFSKDIRQCFKNTLKCGKQTSPPLVTAEFTTPNPAN